MDYIKQRQNYLDAAYAYDLELQSFRKAPFRPASKEEILEYYEDFEGLPGAKIYHLDYNDEYAGFLIATDFPKEFGKEFKSKHKGFHIEEAYVLPKYRRKGIMTKAVSKAISDYKSDAGIDPEITYFILKENKNAIRFWNKTFMNLAYTEDYVVNDFFYDTYEFYLMLARKKKTSRKS